MLMPAAHELGVEAAKKLADLNRQSTDSSFILSVEFLARF
jgi:hypothetical protein